MNLCNKHNNPGNPGYYYKTEICDNWLKKGKCCYYNKCIYAHGNIELMKPGEYFGLPIRKNKQTNKLTIEEIFNNVSSIDTNLKKEYDDNKDYDIYWNIIKYLIINENKKYEFL